MDKTQEIKEDDAVVENPTALQKTKGSHCCGAPVRERDGIHLLRKISKGKKGTKAVMLYECVACGNECKEVYYIKNQFGIWETETKNGRPQKSFNYGRKTLLTDEMIRGLKEAYELDATIGEICLHCNITQRTLWNWRQDNPDLFLFLEGLRANPLMRARRAIVGNVDDPDFALRYVDRKASKEFSIKQTIATEGELRVTQTDEKLADVLKNADPAKRAELLNAIDGLQTQRDQEGDIRG